MESKSSPSNFFPEDEISHLLPLLLHLCYFPSTNPNKFRIMKITTIAMTTTLPLLIIFIISTATPCAASTPKDYYLLSCGASSANPSNFDGRTWQSDDNQTFSSSFTAASTSTSTASTAKPDPSVAQIPFSTARIFTANFTYSFPVFPGPKFLRLYFHPATYSGTDASQFLFSVTANTHHLLSNFSASLSTMATGKFQLIKEYYVNVLDGADSLNLTFSPTPPSSHAFINGIELVPVPENLYVSSTTTPNNVANPNVDYAIGDSAAMETAYRLNIGGSEVGVGTDGSETGIYRLWEGSDDNYMMGGVGLPGLSEDGQRRILYKRTPNYSAPPEVYSTFRSMGLDVKANLVTNLTWRFPVDGGFNYLLRLHWCEVVKDVNETNDRVFSVYINDQTAEARADPLEWSDGVLNTALFRDYVVFVDSNGGGGASTSFISLAMHPVTEQSPRFADVLLNGLEIFKLSRQDGSLNSPNPSSHLPSNTVRQAPIKPSKKASLPAIIGGVSGGIILTGLLVGCFIFRRRRATKVSSGSILHFTKSSTTSTTAASSLPSDLCRHFSFAQIRHATSDFSSNLIIGAGGFGNVYKGTVDGDGGVMKVAIKRSNPLSKQGAREFRTEIEMLSKLRHVHLVSLIGYCDDNSEMILVYEYMSRGTLRDHLYNTENPPLSWIQRLQICVEAARGLHYLHSGAQNMIIHRDVKSSNILIDDNWVAKVSDFGLSKLGPMDGDQATHVSTVVKGSFGYVDPEYYRRQQLTRKSDVYSFGVVLFEVLCGRAAVNPALSKEQVNLAVWARSYQRKGAVEAIVDPSLAGQIAPECLRKFGEVAESCVRDSGADRPSMADVVWSLEFTLQLQQVAEAKGGVVPGSPAVGASGGDVAGDIEVSSAATTPLRRHDSLAMFSSTSSGENGSKTNESSSLITGSSTFEGYSGSNSRSVFSEIFRPEGR